MAGSVPLDLLYGQDYVSFVTTAVTAPLVVVTSRSFSSGRLALTEELQDAGCRVVVGPPDHKFSTLVPLLQGATAWIAGTGPVTAQHLASAPRLRVLARYGAGVDNVDLQAAAAQGILVTNTPGVNTDAVADHALALILAALRDVIGGDRSVRDKTWRVRRTRELGHLQVGLVGFGRIGQAVARRLQGFGGVVSAFDPYVAPDVVEARGVRPVGLLELARTSGVISLHVPGQQVVVDGRFLAEVGSETILVNTARAGAVDEAALAEALREGRLAHYASDVLASETGGPSPLLAEDLAARTLFTPHTAAQTVEAVDRMGRGAVDAVVAALRGETPSHLVVPDGVR
jgi:D-3-phosphoglycerate dehydrogenase / 2-oxoglutarate reductase